MLFVVALKSYISQNKNAILRHCFNPESSVLKVMVCNYSLKTAKWESAGLNFVRETHIFLIYQTPPKKQRVKCMLMMQSVI